MKKYVKSLLKKMVDFNTCQGLTRSGHRCCNRMKVRHINDKLFCCKHLDQEPGYAHNTNSQAYAHNTNSHDYSHNTNSHDYAHNISLNEDECLDDEGFHNFLEQLSLNYSRSEPEEEDCTICMEKMCRSTFVVTICAHKFHSTCLNKWRETGNVTCPLCRINIV